MTNGRQTRDQRASRSLLCSRQELPAANTTTGKEATFFKNRLKRSIGIGKKHRSRERDRRQARSAVVLFGSPGEEAAEPGIHEYWIDENDEHKQALSACKLGSQRGLGTALVNFEQRNMREYTQKTGELCGCRDKRETPGFSSEKPANQHEQKSAASPKIHRIEARKKRYTCAKCG